jgi:hypothetical protein
MKVLDSIGVSHSRLKYPIPPEGIVTPAPFGSMALSNGCRVECRLLGECLTSNLGKSRIKRYLVGGLRYDIVGINDPVRIVEQELFLIFARQRCF